MNIFALDDDPSLAAIWQHDKHVVKMTLETAQLVSCILRVLRRDDWFPLLGESDANRLYRPTHRYHPSTRWGAENVNNFKWLCDHGIALAREYTHRFGRTHKSEAVIQIGRDLVESLPVDSIHRTPFAMAMPKPYKTDDPVVSYRAYYLLEKVNNASKWTHRRADLPKWLFGSALFVIPQPKADHNGRI